uniref:Uncharacterized protein n=1 Tax=Anguilla anguilla TaxID=7936 RepID=A0A0E9W7G2_ANGAN
MLPSEVGNSLTLVVWIDGLSQMYCLPENCQL